MKITNIPLEKTEAFGHFFLDYLQQKEALKPFFTDAPNLENFEKQISLKQDFSTEKRKNLHQILVKQYENFENIPQKQIDLILQKDTFTVTTGHQLCLLTGPLYFIYKIISTINLAKTLQKKYPQYHFIPIFWLASEDHDFEEVNNFSLFGKNYTWQTTQTGAVGRMKTDELAPIFEELETKISPEINQIFKQFYLQSANLSEATRKLVHYLFGKEGLLCLDADEKILKNELKEVIKTEIFEQKIQTITQKTNEKLSNLGYKTQVQPREINFFFLKDDRQRIVKEGEDFKVLNINISLSSTEMLEKIEQNPEYFSPNVLIRPLYQEIILPNLAYIAGPSELTYWLQLKPIFDAFSVPYPILLARNFALIIPKQQANKLQKLGLSTEILFTDEYHLKQYFIKKNSLYDVMLTQEVAILQGVYQQILAKAMKIDKSLEGSVGVEKHKTMQGLTNLEKKMQKMEEKRQETDIQQLVGLKNKLFPQGNLQERKENFLNFYANNLNFVEILLQNLNPFVTKMYIFQEEL